MAHGALSVKTSLSVGYEGFKREWKMLFLYGLVMMLVNMLFSGLAQLFVDVVALAAVVNFVSWIVQMVMQLAGVIIALEVVDGKSLSKDSLVAAFKSAAEVKTVIAFVVASILYGLIVFGGTLLLIVPGIIWALMFQFYRYLVVDKGMGARESLSRSKEMTKGNLGFLFVFGLALIGINILGLLALVVGLVVSVGISFVASAYVYRQLSGDMPAPEPSVMKEDVVPNTGGNSGSATLPEPAQG